MKLIRYILLTLLLPVFPAGAQNLCGSTGYTSALG